MFSWLKNWLRDRKIDADFERVERLAVTTCIREADKRFATEELEKEIQTRMAAPLREADSLFAEAIARFDKMINAQSGALSRQRALLEILQRDYAGELDALYAELNELTARINQLYEHKKEAQGDLQTARECIDAWYQKSRSTCFGNAGKQLPRHAFFGQSFGDLECYKSDRDQAYQMISECGQEIQSLKEEKRELIEQIQSVKQARGEMFRLRRQEGYSIRRLERRLSELDHRLGKDRDRLHKVEAERAAFLDLAKRNNGAEQLENRVGLLRKQRELFVRAFGDPAAVAERRRIHREQWLRQTQ